MFQYLTYWLVTSQYPSNSLTFILWVPTAMKIEGDKPDNPPLCSQTHRRGAKRLDIPPPNLQTFNLRSAMRDFFLYWLKNKNKLLPFC